MRSASNPHAGGSTPERVGFLERQGVIISARGAHQVDVFGLLGPVVLRAALEMRVLEDADLLEQRERAIDGGRVYARHLARIFPRDDGGGDVPLGMEYRGKMARRWGVMRNPCREGARSLD